MADTPPPIKISQRLVDINTYKKYAGYVLITIAGILLVVGGVSLWRFIFVPKDSQVHKPRAIVLPLGKIEKLDQSSQQILVEEKPWEVSLFGGVFRWDQKDGYGGGIKVTRKF